MAALSRTLRDITWLQASPAQPSPTNGPIGLRPRLGFRPNRPHCAAGMRIEPPPSLPWAIGTIPAATAAADPPDEPPAVRSRFQGLRVGPVATGSVEMLIPSSEVAVRPKLTSPAARQRAT